MQTILTALLPLVLIIALGVASRRRGWLSAAAGTTCTGLAYWLCLPALLVVKIGGADWNLAAAAELSGIVLAATLLTTLVAGLFAWLGGLRPGGRGVLLQAVGRGNLAFVGLPVIVVATSALAEAGAVQAMAVVALGPVIVVYNLLAVVALSWDSDGSRPGWGRLASRLLGNPLLIACALGLLLAASPWPLPQALDLTLGILADGALPLALLGLGIGLGALPEVKEGERPLSPNWARLAAGLKCLLCPALGALLCYVFDTDPGVRLAALIYLACPTAVASYVLVAQIGGDTGLAARSVWLSTLLSPVPLAVILWWVKLS